MSLFLENSLFSFCSGSMSDILLLIRLEVMAGPGRSMLYSLLLFATILSLLEMCRGKLASSELLTIFGGFISSLLFLVLLTVSSKCPSCYFILCMLFFAVMLSACQFFSSVVTVLCFSKSAIIPFFYMNHFSSLMPISYDLLLQSLQMNVSPKAISQNRTSSS